MIDTELIEPTPAKVYDLPLVRDYVAHWGVAEAVRELVQNALDSDSPFIYDFTQEDDDTFTLTLDSENAYLPTRSLLLGATTKATQDDKIGHFGEGYKIAMLVLARLGKAPVIWNRDRHWLPYFRSSEAFGAEILAIEETAMGTPWKGLRFLVSNLTAEEVDKIKAGCIRMQSSIGPIRQTTWGEILIDQKGKLYVGGLFVCDTDMHYGYNIRPEYLKLERDRQTVDGWDLAKMTRKMWYATEEWERIAQMITAEVPDMEYAQIDAPQLVKEACYAWFKQQHPGALVAATQQELKDMIARGMTKTVYVGSNAGTLIKGATDYKVVEAKVVQLTPTQVLEAFRDKTKFMKRQDRERAFKQLLEQSRRWRLS